MPIEGDARGSGTPAAVALAGFWIAMLTVALLGPTRTNLVPAFAAYSIAFLALVFIWSRHRRLLDDPRVLLGGALLLRLIFLPTLPDLSDDLFRYVWDGWLSASGINPFRYIPSDPRLVDFQGSDLFTRLNSPDYHSIYPPLSQIGFLLGGIVYSSAGWPTAAFATKGFFAVCEAGGVALLFFALRRANRRPSLLALYAWNPLVVVTLAGSGHTEGGLVLGMGALAFGIASGGARIAWIGLVLAGASKGLPFLLVPLLARHHLARIGTRRTIVVVVPAAALAAALALPFVGPGILAAVASSAELYVRLFEFNAGPYALLEAVARALTGEDLGWYLGPILRVAFLGTVLVLWARARVADEAGLYRAGIAVFALYLLTATTVHPWYLVWGLVWIPLTPFLRGAWIWASWAGFATYFTYIGVPGAMVSAVFWGGVTIAVGLASEARVRNRLLRFAGRRKGRQIRPHLSGRLALDLGAGEGYVAEALSRGDGGWLVMDVGPFFRVPLSGVVYDGTRIPLHDRSVNTVVISLALHHASDPRAVVSEALRVASDRVVVTESTFEGELERRILVWADRLANRKRGMAGHPQADNPVTFRRVAEWESLFREMGASVVHSARVNRVGHRHHLFVLEPAALESVEPASRAN